MPRSKPLTVTGFFRNTDGSVIPMEQAMEERGEEILREWNRRWERNMSDYYSKHPEEFERLEEVSDKEKEIYYKLFPEKRNDRFTAVDP